MNKDFLELINNAEAEAEQKIEAARKEAARIERDAEDEAADILTKARRDAAYFTENRISSVRYDAKKSVDNKKTFLNIQLNDAKLKAAANIDKAADIVVGGIING